MRIKSPLSDLSKTIGRIKESAAQYRNTLQGNEAATRAVLIDPILQALGWNTADTDMVEVEKGRNQVYVDYALYDRNGNVSLIVEAKRLGENLNDRTVTKSLFSYAHIFGTKNIFLTDGLIWQFVTIGQPGDFDILTKNFLEDKIVDCAAFLVERLDAARFWPEEETIDELAQRIGQLESNLTTIQNEMIQLRELQGNRDIAVDSSQSDTAKPTVNQPTYAYTVLGPTSALDEEKFIDLARIGDITKTVPILLRLPDGTILKVRRWKDVLLECCKLALNTNPNIPIPLPDRANRKVLLINWVRPGPGLAFVEEQYNGQTIYIYTNYDANNSVANAVHVLRQVPENVKTVDAGVVFQKA